jgi:phage tail-like protein
LAIPTLGINAAFELATGALGVRLDPFGAFRFLVEIEGLIAGGFSEVDGLQVEIEIFDYREGGQNRYVHRLPGPAAYPQYLVLRHGLTDIPSLWLWQQAVARGEITRRNGTIYLLDSRGLPRVFWSFIQAYPVRWTGPELRAGTNTVALETLELVHRGIKCNFI